MQPARHSGQIWDLWCGSRGAFGGRRCIATQSNQVFSNERFPVSIHSNGNLQRVKFFRQWCLGLAPSSSSTFSLSGSILITAKFWKQVGVFG